jgi:hypothetical protein
MNRERGGDRRKCVYLVMRTITFIDRLVVNMVSGLGITKAEGKGVNMLVL